MNNSIRYLLGVLAGAALLGGCSNSSTAVAGTPLAWAEQHGIDDRGQSWMAPDAKKQDLLYVSNDSGRDVTVYSYPGGKLEGRLTGFGAPNGECTDKAGNVFITDFGASAILEYAHGGASPIATLNDPGERPEGCSVDPKTGNLAVTNQLTTRYASGNLAIYPNASGTPTTYTSPNFYEYFFCAYDETGNVYIDGLNSSSPEFAELPAGSSKLQSFTIDQNIKFPVGIQWDGKYVAIGGRRLPQIFEFQISGSTGTLKRRTDIKGAMDVVAFWIQSGKNHKKILIGPDPVAGDVADWHYPAGGGAFKTITQGLDAPFGATVSQAR